MLYDRMPSAAWTALSGLSRGCAIRLDVQRSMNSALKGV